MSSGHSAPKARSEEVPAAVAATLPNASGSIQATAQSDNLMATNVGRGLVPNDGTACIPNEPRKKFGVGSVVLVTDPNTEGWWTPSDMPPDGFYYVLWDTHRIDLKDNKYYRIKVFLDGVAGPLGYVDVQQVENERKWRNVQTGDVIAIEDDAVLPIPFRVESGALCGGATDCTSTEVTNSGATVQVNVDGEAVAGARFPPGWLPEGGPQSVIVTISHVNTGETNSDAGTQEIPCHAGLPFEQFDACYKFTTTPTLAFIGSGRQFAIPVTVAVCYVLEGSRFDETGPDPRRDFAQMYASGPNEPPHALEDVSDEGILSPAAKNCTPTSVGIESSNPVLHVASAAWRKFKAGVSELFGVKTAYAIDVGLGGLIDGFSNVGAVLPATIQAYPSGATRLAVVEGAATASVQIVGNHHHSGTAAYSGINAVQVTFTVAANNGSLGDGEGVSDQVVTNTHRVFIPNTENSVDGIASVTWFPPTRPGTYRMTASGPTMNGPVTFRVTVR